MYFLISLTGLTLIGILTIYIFIMGNKKVAVKYFRVFLLFLTIYLLGESIIRLYQPDRDIFKISLRLLYFPAQCGLFFSFFLFTSVYPCDRKLSKYISYSLMILTTILAFFPLIFKPSSLTNIKKYYNFIQPHQLDLAAYGYNLALFKNLFLISLFSYGIYLLISAYFLETNSRSKNSLKYIILSSGGPLLLTATTEMILPFIFPDSHIFPMMSIGAIICAIVFSYAISKHEILDLRLVIKNSLLYSLLTAIISAAYLLLAEIATVFVSILIPKATLLVSYFFVLATLLVVAPIRNKLQWFLDSYIFQDKYDYQHILDEIFNIIPYINEKNRLIPSVLSLIKKNLKAKEIILLLPEDRPALYISNKEDGFTTIPNSPFSKNSILINLLSSNKNLDIINVNHASINESKNYIKLMEELKLIDSINPSFILPLRNEKLIGFLLIGDKENGKLYSKEDINLLKTIARELTICIERVNSLNVTSKKKSENVMKEAETQKLLQLKDSLKSISKLQKAFDNKTKRQILKNMVDEEKEKLERDIKRLSKKIKKDKK